MESYFGRYIKESTSCARDGKLRWDNRVLTKKKNLFSRAIVSSVIKRFYIIIYKACFVSCTKYKRAFVNS